MLAGRLQTLFRILTLKQWGEALEGHSGPGGTKGLGESHSSNSLFGLPHQSQWILHAAGTGQLQTLADSAVQLLLRGSPMENQMGRRRGGAGGEVGLESCEALPQVIWALSRAWQLLLWCFFSWTASTPGPSLLPQPQSAGSRMKTVAPHHTKPGSIFSQKAHSHTWELPNPFTQKQAPGRHNSSPPAPFTASS